MLAPPTTETSNGIKAMKSAKTPFSLPTSTDYNNSRIVCFLDNNALVIDWHRVVYV